MLMLCSASRADTNAIVAVIAGLARPGDLIVLAGEMGAGKTAFAQGFGTALGVTEVITSPTFTLVHSYPCSDGRTTLHHADVYRLDRTGDIDDLALHELAEFGGIVLIEWGDVVAAAIGDHLEVRLRHDDDDDLDDDGAGATADDDDDLDDDAAFELDDGRTIELAASGGRWAGRWDRLSDQLVGFRC